MIHIGTTGTQIGGTNIQHEILSILINEFKTPDDNWFHAGDCIGWDDEASGIARNLGYLIHGHPPINSRKRAWFKFDFVEEPKEYLVRNRDIVDMSSIVIASPKTRDEELRSGTWATIRYAKSLNKELFVLNPY